MEESRWEVLREFLSDDHVEVGFTGTIGKAEVVAGVASSECVVKSYKWATSH